MEQDALDFENFLISLLGKYSEISKDLESARKITSYSPSPSQHGASPLATKASGSSPHGQSRAASPSIAQEISEDIEESPCADSRGSRHGGRR